MESKNQATLWIVIAALLGLLFGCMGGALAGGLAGYTLGRKPAPATAPRPYEFRLEPTPLIPEPRPSPLPTLPEVPLLQGAALVTQVIPQSPAEQAGIQVGDMIMAVDEVSLEEAPLADLIARYQPGDVVTLTLWRAARQLRIEVELGEHPEKSGAPWLGIYYHEMPAGWSER